MAGLIVGGCAGFCPNEPANMCGLEQVEMLNKKCIRKDEGSHIPIRTTLIYLESCHLPTTRAAAPTVATGISDVGGLKKDLTLYDAPTLRRG
jgi:hypothetical protein